MVHHKFLWVGEKQTKKVEPQSHSDLAICYAMKEELLRLFELKDHTEAEQGWKRWFDAAINSSVPAPAEFGRQKLKRLDGLVAHASFTVNTGKLEGLNNKIKVAKRNAYGFRKHDYVCSYRTTNNNNSVRVIDKYHIQLPKLGIVRCKLPGLPKGRILHATITMTASGEYRISVQCESILQQTCEKTGRAIGVDMGVKNLAITSDGTTYDNPKSYEKNQKRLKRLQRQLSRKPKDSKNREKNRKKIAKLYQHIRNQRKDATHKMTHDLIKKYDYICIEDLRPSEMVKDKRLSKAISDANFGEIRRQLEYKSAWHQKQLIVVDRWFPSSQTCYKCGYQNRAVKNLGIRYRTCPYCKTEHDRDTNAAINILHEGLEREKLIQKVL